MSTTNQPNGFVSGFITGTIATAAFLYFFTSRRGREHTKRLLEATEDVEGGVADVFDELLDRYAAPNHPPKKEETPASRLLAAGTRLLDAARARFTEPEREGKIV